MHSRIDDRQHAATGLSADQDRTGSYVRPAAKHGDGRVDIGYCAVRAAQRGIGIAGISGLAVPAELFIIEPIGFSATPTLRKGHEPTSAVEKIGDFERGPALPGKFGR